MRQPGPRSQHLGSCRRVFLADRDSKSKAGLKAKGIGHEKLKLGLVNGSVGGQDELAGPHSQPDAVQSRGKSQ